MRGVWSTLIMVLVLAGLVGYIYFVDSKRDPSGTPPGEAVHLGAGRRHRGSADQERRRRDDSAAKSRRQVASRRAGQAAADTSERRRSPAVCRRSKFSASSTRTRPISSNTGSSRRASRSRSGRKGRRISSGCRSGRRHRPAAIFTRVFPIKARVPGVVVSRQHVQQEHVRCATAAFSSSIATWWMDWI